MVTESNHSKFYNQKRATKSCQCGRGRIYTDHAAQFNAVVNGKQVCPECYIENLLNGFEGNNCGDDRN